MSTGLQVSNFKVPRQGVRERARVFETLNYFEKARPDVAVLCAFSGNTIACSCSMSATGEPSKALKVRPPAVKHYQLRHSLLVPLPNSLIFSLLLHISGLQVWVWVSSLAAG